MAGERFLKAQFGKQAQLGTLAAMEAQWPGQGEYQDASEDHEAPFDSGTWTPVTIVEKMADYATFTLKGTAFFELLPVLFNAGIDAVVPTSEITLYKYAYVLDPAKVGAPAAYTWLFGGGEKLGATGPAVRAYDAFCESITLSGNLNSKEVGCESKWFAAAIDDKQGAGYAWEAGINLPAGIEMLKTLNADWGLEDAGVAGGVFASESILGKLLDWTLTINTGVRPDWSADRSTLTFRGVIFDAPSIEYKPVVRTDAATYALIRAKFAARAYQQLRHEIYGSIGQEAVFHLTGRWTACPSAHERENGEVVMKPTFVAQTPHTQTTTPHYADFALITAWSHGGA